MLHILNGSSIEETLKQSPVPGDFFSFRDALISGPAPGGLDETSWLTVRAQHLADSYGVDLTKATNELLIQQQVLSSALTHNEVVLWFEHDLFCQLNLLYLLNLFGNSNTKLSLISIGQFPGRENFRGLGELNATELASLFPQRQALSVEQLSLARKAWKAFSSNNPTALERLWSEDTSSLPFLSQSLKAHLRRFPALKNGLGKIENRNLELVDDGARSFRDLFPAFVAAEPVYGLGDAQVWNSLIGLCGAGNPLLSTNSFPRTNEISPETVFEITDAGRAVLNGEADYLELNEIDTWLGGVHLQGSNIWRWDEVSERLISYSKSTAIT